MTKAGPEKCEDLWGKLLLSMTFFKLNILVKFVLVVESIRN